ncbi:MAG: YceI family protein [Verrucomicrobiia bacterium]
MKYVSGLLLICCGTSMLAAAESVPLVVDRSQSRIEVDVKATVGSFVGHLADYDLSIEVDPVEKRVNSATLSFKFSDVETGEAKRDKHMHKWQDTEKFPDVSFILRRLESTVDGRFNASGQLALHGQTQAIQFPVSVLQEGEEYLVEVEAVVDTQLFGLPIIRMFLALKVDPLVTVRMSVRGTATEPK